MEAIFQDEFDTLPPVVSNKLQRSIELSSGKPAATALAEVACDVFGGFFTGVIHKSRTTRGPLIKAQRPSTLMLAPSTQDMLAQHLNAPGYGQLQSFPPGPAASSPRDSSASGASGPTSTPTLSTFKAPSPLPPGTSGNKSVSLVDGPAGRWHRMNQRHLPAPSPLAHPSMCSGCFQPEGTACACFTPWDLEVDFGTPALDLSTAAEGFAFNQAPAL